MDKQAYEHMVGLVLSKKARFVFDPASLSNENINNIKPIKGGTTTTPPNSYDNRPTNPVNNTPPGMSSPITAPKLGNPGIQNTSNKYRGYPMPNVANEQEYKRMYPNAIGTYAQDRQIQSLAKSVRPTLNPPLKSPFMQ